jgi:hypothetical protein
MKEIPYATEKECTYENFIARCPLCGFRNIFNRVTDLQECIIYSVISHNNGCHSRESGNPDKHWIPAQARNDKLHKTYVAMYNVRIFLKIAKLSSFFTDSLRHGLGFIYGIYTPWQKI